VLAASPLTNDGMIAGSPSYIAPEVWRGNPRVLDHRIDVYSLGAITFRALSGSVPFAGHSLIEKFQLATTGDRPSLYAERPDLPREIDSWVAQALAIDPDMRFHQVRGMWNALRSVLGIPRQ
jgi:serine/threonine-protein kinase